MTPTLVLNSLIAFTLVAIAWRLLTTDDMFMAVVLFVTYGVMMSLCWVRLGAPDLALVEVAIGAGLTGALFLNTLGRIEAVETEQRGAQDGAHVLIDKGRHGTRILAAVLVVPVVVVVGWAALDAGRLTDSLAPLVAARLADSGVEHDVTAVLMNFRAYDTLLEITVLVIALLGAWSLRVRQATPLAHQPSPLLVDVVRHLVPLMILVAGYLLWVGAYRPGGEFHAGALLAAAGVLLLLSRSPLVANVTRRIGVRGVRIAALAGLLVFVAVGLGAMAATGEFLHFPAGHAGALILTIEALATVSIGVVLMSMFAGTPPGDAAGVEAGEAPEGRAAGEGAS